MEVSKLLQRLYISKVAKTRLADTELTVKPVEWEEVVELLVEFIEAFGTLKTAVGDGRLRGEPGRDGTTPVPDKDYLSRGESERMIRTLCAEIAKTVRNGEDAEVTEEHLWQAAQMAHALIELPDFATLITENPYAIRDALELLAADDTGDERLSIDAIAGLREALADAAKRGPGSVGATIARRLGQIGDVNVEGATVGQVLTRQANGFGFETPTGGGGSLTIKAVTGTINGSNTEFTIPEGFTGKSWIRLNTTVLLEDVDYTVSGVTITYNSAPPAGLSGKPHHLICAG